MKRLKSIQSIIKKYDTQGSSPVLIMANDLNQWVCKYRDVNQLFNELLAYQFAKIWQINIPEGAFIEIDYEKHIKPLEDKRGLERMQLKLIKQYLQTKILLEGLKIKMICSK